MALLLDSFWRAAAYCLHPRVVALSVLPLLLMVAVAIGAGWLLWDPAVDTVFRALEQWALLTRIGDWLQDLGVGGLRTVIAPLVVIFLATPLIVLGSLVAVALLMTPALVRLVARRRFPQLDRRRGGSLAGSLLWTLASALLALLALVLTLPLWLIPPLVLVIPPLVWGWLTYRVMAFDALAEHASADERRLLLRRHRLPLLGIGIATGLLGAAPSVVWASGALFAAAFVLLVPVAIWIYTLVFAFSSLWFTHYALAALAQLRAVTAQAAPATPLPARAAPAPLASGHEHPS